MMSLHSRLGSVTGSVAAPASMKKYAAHFFISDFIGTEPAEAPPQLLVKLLEWEHYSKKSFFNLQGLIIQPIQAAQ